MKRWIAGVVVLLLGTLTPAIWLWATPAPVARVESSGEDFPGPIERLPAELVGDVVLLGDSFTSGEGTGTYSRSANPQCHRSVSAYGYALIANSNIVNLACSGARTYNILDTHFGDHPPQLEQLHSFIDDGGVPGAIFLTTGGNDIFFVQTVERCFLGDCTEDRDWMIERARDFPGVADALIEVAAAVNTPELVERRRGALAPVIVSAYPNPLGDRPDQACSTTGLDVVAEWLIHSQTDATDLGFRNAEAELALELLTELNAKLEASVDEADAAGWPVHFVAETADFADGHSVCDPEPYFVPLTIAGAVASVRDGERRQELLHPNTAGHQAWAETLRDWLAGEELWSHD